MEKIKETIPDKPRQEHERVLTDIEKIFEYMDYLSVFSVDGGDEINGLDDAILYGILKAQKKKTEEEKGANLKNMITSQLKLALTWNRIDVANKFIFSDDKLWETETLRDVMYIAIHNNRAEFVKAFLDNGLVLSKFLTYRMLIKLYNDVSVAKNS